MECEILASVMNQKNKDEIIKRLGISDGDKCLIINQIDGNKRVDKDVENGDCRFLSCKDKGLSKSRNLALRKAVGDVCIIVDDDVKLIKNYKKLIVKAYEKYPDADIIAFEFEYNDCNKNKKKMSERRIDYLHSMKISSTQITFKRKSIKESEIKFDEDFGAGSGKNNWGEENIFLFDCLRAGLKIYYVPIKIMTKYDLGSTWDKSNTKEHFEQQGAIYYRMSSRFWRMLALQFVLRKRKIYSKDMSSYSVFKAMIKGARKYRRGARDV